MNTFFLVIAYIVTFVAVYYVAYKHGELNGYDDGLFIGKKSVQGSTTKQ